MKKGNSNEEGNYRKTEGNKIHAETRDCSEHNNIEPGTFIKLSRHVRNKCRQQKENEFAINSDYAQTKIVYIQSKFVTDQYCDAYAGLSPFKLIF